MLAKLVLVILLPPALASLKLLEKLQCPVSPDINLHISECKSPTENQGDFNHTSSVLTPDKGDNLAKLPHGTICTQRLAPTAFKTFICDRGQWRQLTDTSHADLILLSRRRRETFPLKKLFSVNTPPKISCPFITSPVYTDPGNVTAIVSWNVPTAHDQQDEHIQVIQIQGQAPDTEHTEGNYTVAYIARDTGGLVDICSTSFSVSVHRCPFNFTYLLNGDVNCQPNKHNNIVGSTCSYFCHQGYQLLGNSTLQCLRQDTWSGEKPKCVGISCGPPQNGSFVCQTDQYTYRSQCVLACDIGYTVKNLNKTIECQADGHWSPPGTCELKSCQEYILPENAEVVNCSHGNMYSSVCTVKCKKPYTLEGEATQTCLANQTWSSKQPKCIGKCLDPPKDPHGNYICPNGHTYLATCSLQCGEGFKLTGPTSITCNTSFQWTQAGFCLDIEAPTIVGKCPSDLSIIGFTEQTVVNYMLPHAKDNSGESVKVIGNPPSGSSFKVSATPVVITALDSTQNNATICQFKVIVKVFTCQDPRLGLSESDPVQFNCSYGHVFGANCTASCANGAELKGSGTITCIKKFDYDAVQWTPLYDMPLPYCQGQCSPGQFSNTGQQPCEICDIGFYQTKYNQTSCHLCPSLTKTYISGARSIDDCKSFQLEMNPPILPSLIQLPGTVPQAFTLVSWLYLNILEKPMRSFASLGLKFTLDPDASTDAKNGAIVHLNSLGIFIFFKTDPQLRSNRFWYHIALVYENEICTLYVNGQFNSRITRTSVANLKHPNLTIDFPETYMLFTKAPITAAGLQMTDRALTVEELLDLYQSCGKQLEKNLLITTKVEESLSPSQCDDEDDCLGIPCGQHGKCLDGPGHYTCICDQHWSGKRCEIPPNYCTDHICVNGAKCHNNVEFFNYTCECTEGFKGALCQEKIENGGWSTWSEWSQCSASCGLGQRSWTRQCNNPRPDPQGHGCTGETTHFQECLGNSCPEDGEWGMWSAWSICSKTCGEGEQRRRHFCDSPAPLNGGAGCDQGYAWTTNQCNKNTCPECSSLTQRPGHQSINCTTYANTSVMACQVICKPGLTLVPVINSVVYCGLSTNYSWTHQTARNPTAMLPDCADQKQPVSITAQVDFVYRNLTCSMAPSNDTLTAAIMSAILKRLNCSSESKCNVFLTVNSTCSNSGVQGTVTVQVGTRDGSASFYLSTLSEEEMRAEISKAIFVGQMFLEIINISQEALKMSQNQTVTTAVTHLTVKCENGSGFYNGFCVDCTPGTYSVGDGSCAMCDKGYFQNENRAMSCVPCPECLTTSAVGSYSLTHCSIIVCSNTTSEEFSAEGQIIIIVAVVSSVGASLIFTAVILLIIIRNTKKESKEETYTMPNDQGVNENTIEDTNIYAEIIDYLSVLETSGYINPVDSSGSTYYDNSKDKCCVPEDGDSSPSEVHNQDLSDLDHLAENNSTVVGEENEMSDEQ